jgi:hypothetical protein
MRLTVRMVMRPEALGATGSEAVMRKPPKTQLGSRYPVHPSNDVRTVLILACAMMAMIVALTAIPNDAGAMVGFLH